MRRFGFLVLALGLLPAPGLADEPLTLADAMARARERSREAVAAGARKEAAAARARQAAGFRLPSVSFSETYVRTDAPAESFAFQLNREQFSFPEFVSSDPNDPGWSGTAVTRLEATFPLFTGGELSTRIKQAESAATAADRTAVHTSNRVALEAAEAYVMVAQAEEYELLLTKARETVAAHVALAKAYVDQGMLVRSELLRAEVELARIDDLLAEARGRVRVANASLAFRLGEPQEKLWALAALPSPRPLEGDAASWVATAASRADLAAAREMLKAGELEEKAKKAGYFPRLAVVGRYDLYSKNLFGADGQNGTVMAVLQWNLFAGGSDKAAAIAAREEARAGREDVARFEEGVGLEVRQAYEEAATARSRHETALMALVSARESERITSERWKAGVVKTLDLLDATTARREAETRELVARAEAHGKGLRLALAAGRAPESVLP